MNYKYNICLGSNQGNKKGFLKSAKYLLEKEGFSIEKESSYYETEPVDMGKNTETFINQVISGSTKKDTHSFLATTKDIEKKIGRINKGDHKDRVIDIDILTCDDLVIHEKDFKLPHAEMTNRRFVLEPLCEISPDLIHPIEKKSIKVILNKLKDKHKVKRLLDVKSVY